MNYKRPDIPPPYKKEMMSGREKRNTYHIYSIILVNSLGKETLQQFLNLVRVPDYRFRSQGSIPGATRFSEK
jgi:hypothetical protein